MPANMERGKWNTHEVSVTQRRGKNRNIDCGLLSRLLGSWSQSWQKKIAGLRRGKKKHLSLRAKQCKPGLFLFLLPYPHSKLANQKPCLLSIPISHWPDIVFVFFAEFLGGKYVIVFFLVPFRLFRLFWYHHGLFGSSDSCQSTNHDSIKRIW